jgi:hypothetical protein
MNIPEEVALSLVCLHPEGHPMKGSYPAMEVPVPFIFAYENASLFF